MWSVHIDPEKPFVYSIFGVQYKGEKPNEVQQARLDVFDKLISPSANYIENIIQEDSTSGTNTKIWLAYWKSMLLYQEWWKQSDVAEFWTSLPENAGMYREVLTVPRGRTQMGLSAEKKEGMAHVGTMKPMDMTKTGYWGCYRNRYEDGGKKDQLPSSLPTPPRAQKGTGKIRPGRVLMTTFPENLCFVVEGQDHSSISVEEKNHWFENFDASVTNWITDLVEAPPSAGILDKRLCYVPESGKYRHSSPDALNYNRKVQLFYFLDHDCMERIGKTNKGHVNLRNNFLASYCPTGAMGQIAKLLLWVETSVVKSDEIECEYVGCLEGTGFMAYDNHSAFESKGDAGWMSYLKSWIPGF